jgi:hypothetical protein
MSSQQTTGFLVLSFGIGALMVSAGVAWVMSRLSRTRPIEGAWLLSAADFLLFLASLVLCYFGILAIVEGR